MASNQPQLGNQPVQLYSLNSLPDPPADYHINGKKDSNVLSRWRVDEWRALMRYHGFGYNDLPPEKSKRQICLDTIKRIFYTKFQGATNIQLFATGDVGPGAIPAQDRQQYNIPDYYLTEDTAWQLLKPAVHLRTPGSKKPKSTKALIDWNVTTQNWSHADPHHMVPPSQTAFTQTQPSTLAATSQTESDWIPPAGQRSINQSQLSVLPGTIQSLQSALPSEGQSRNDSVQNDQPTWSFANIVSVSIAPDSSHLDAEEPTIPSGLPTEIPDSQESSSDIADGQKEPIPEIPDSQVSSSDIADDQDLPNPEISDRQETTQSAAQDSSRIIAPKVDQGPGQNQSKANLDVDTNTGPSGSDQNSSWTEESTRISTLPSLSQLPPFRSPRRASETEPRDGSPKQHDPVTPPRIKSSVPAQSQTARPTPRISTSPPGPLSSISTPTPAGSPSREKKISQRVLELMDPTGDLQNNQGPRSIYKRDGIQGYPKVPSLREVLGAATHDVETGIDPAPEADDGTGSSAQVPIVAETPPALLQSEFETLQPIPGLGASEVQPHPSPSKMSESVTAMGMLPESPPPASYLRYSTRESGISDATARSLFGPQSFSQESQAENPDSQGPESVLGKRSHDMNDPEGEQEGKRQRLA